MTPEDFTRCPYCGSHHGEDRACRRRRDIDTDHPNRKRVLL